MTVRQALIQRVLEQQDRLFCYLRIPQTHALLTIDLTMPQLKALVILDALGSATGGQLGRGLGVGLSTVTGIVDRLWEHGLVTRGEDPDDRRVTRVLLTPAGRDLVEKLYRIRHEQMATLLERLSVSQLEQTAQAVEFLADAAAALAVEASEGDDHDALPLAFAAAFHRAATASGTPNASPPADQTTPVPAGESA